VSASTLPAFDCDRCGRRIGKTDDHHVLHYSRVLLCSRCVELSLDDDGYDPVECTLTRAGIATAPGMASRQRGWREPERAS